MRGGGNSPVSDFYVDLGKSLARVRATKGMSLADVETASGGRWNASLIGGYERASRRIHIEFLYELAEFYGVPIATFLPSSDGAVMVQLDAVIEKLRALGPAASGAPDPSSAAPPAKGNPAWVEGAA